jgi:hypothetical protein
MKILLKILLYSFIFISIISSLFASSNLYDSTSETRFALPPKDTTNKGFDLIFISGVGVASGQNFSDYFKPSLALTLGFEIPFTKSHFCSIESIIHSWFANNYSNENILNKYFIKLSSNTYSQLGLSIVFKYYFFSNK